MSNRPVAIGSALLLVIMVIAVFIADTPRPAEATWQGRMSFNGDFLASVRCSVGASDSVTYYFHRDSTHATSLDPGATKRTKVFFLSLTAEGSMSGGDSIRVYSGGLPTGSITYAGIGATFHDIAVPGIRAGVDSFEIFSDATGYLVFGQGGR